MKNSQIIIGTASWGSKINFNKSIDIGNSIILMGLNHFDTAPNYGNGFAESCLGKLNNNPSNLIFYTKFGSTLDGDKD